MEPEEKAKELVEKFVKTVPEDFGGMQLELAKQCALIVVEEILFAFEHGFAGLDQSDVGPDMIYWQKVKQAIINMK